MSAAISSANPIVAAWRKLATLAEAIRIEHTVFALPFAYLALFLVEGGWPELGHFLWITLAMAGARTIAMAANRLIDAEIDGRNPRTKGRAIPAGRVKKAEMLLFTAVALTLFLLAIYNLSGRAQQLWPIALAPMILYPYLKRFTWLCHFGISAVYVIIPPAVWIAVTGEFTLAAMLLGIGAGLWVAGFDLIYAAQDVEFDRTHGLRSIPADFGVGFGLLLARIIHLGAAAFIIAAGLVLNAGWLYYVGSAAFVGLLIYEHRVVSPGDLSRIQMAFFNMNGLISVLFFMFVMLDVVL